MPDNPPKVIFKDASGKIIPPDKRYDVPVMVYVRTKKGHYRKRTVQPIDLDPKGMARMLTREQYESVPIIEKEHATVKGGRGKYHVLEMAKKIDKTKGIRRQPLILDVHLKSKATGEKFIKPVYIKIKKNQEGSFFINSVIHDALIGEGYMVYESTPTKIIAARYGLDKVKVEKIVIKKAKK